MTAKGKVILKKLNQQPESPAYRFVKKLASAPAVKISTSASAAQEAGEVLSIWLMRFQNATLRGRRFTGLTSLLRALNQLPPDAPITQLALIDGLTTALIFLRADTQEPIGAVISVRTKEDVARSHANYERTVGKTSVDDLIAA